MAGPWEKYAPDIETTSGPWTKYAPETAPAVKPQAANRSAFGEWLDDLGYGGQKIYSDVSDYVKRQLAEEPERPQRPVIPSREQAVGIIQKLDKTPLVPETGNSLDVNDRSIPIEERAKRLIARSGNAQARWDEQKAFDESRTPLRRASDTAVWGLSQPARAVSGGELGFGDVFGVTPSLRDQYQQQEADFQRANPGIVGTVNHLASVGLGTPQLSGLGHAEGGFNALARAKYDQMTTPRPSAPVNALAASPAQLIGPEARLASIQDFRDANIPPFGPALGSKGTARTARTIEEMPLIGGTVKVPKNEVELAAAAEKNRITQELGAAESKDQAGLIAQNALNRFRTADLQDLERQRLEAIGVNPDRPPSAAAPDTVQIPRASQLDTSTLTPQQLRLAAQARVSFPETQRSTIQDLSPADLNRIIEAPANETSFATKQAALYRRADDAMPAIMRENESRNPNLFAQRESAAVAKGLLEQEKSASINGGILTGRFGPLVRKLMNPKATMTIDNMQAARTEVGRALAEGNQLDASLSRTQLKQLYGALTNDIERALVGVAARARIQANEGKLAPEIADQADQALHLTRVANRYTRAGMERMDRFMNVLNANSIEQAGQKIAQYLRDNTQNVQALETVASALRPEEWRAVLGHVIDNLGRLTPGAREAERVFPFERFATDFNKLSQSPRVRALLVRGLGEETVGGLERLSRVAERMKYYETTKNYSGTAYTGMGVGAAAGIFHPSTILPVVGTFLAAGGAGKLLTSQAFVKWLETVYKAQRTTGNSLNAIGKIATEQGPIKSLRDAASRETDPRTRDLMLSLVHAFMQGGNVTDISTQKKQGLQ